MRVPGKTSIHSMRLATQLSFVGERTGAQVCVSGGVVSNSPISNDVIRDALEGYGRCNERQMCFESQKLLRFASRSQKRSWKPGSLGRDETVEGNSGVGVSSTQLNARLPIAVRVVGLQRTRRLHVVAAGPAQARVRHRARRRVVGGSRSSR